MGLLAGAAEGERCRLVDGTTGVLRTEALVLGTVRTTLRCWSEGRLQKQSMQANVPLFFGPWFKGLTDPALFTNVALSQAAQTASVRVAYWHGPFATLAGFEAWAAGPAPA